MYIAKFKIAGDYLNKVAPTLLTVDEHDSVVWTNEEQEHIAKLLSIYDYGRGEDSLYIRTKDIRVEYVICPDVPAYLDHI